MKPLAAILRAVARAMRRDAGSFFALKVNNFFLFVLLLVEGNLVSGLPPRSAYPFLMRVGFLLMFPLSSDPMAKIPAVRNAMWPLTAWQRAGLRMVSVALSPLFWLAAILFLRTSVSLGLAFIAMAAAMQAGMALAGRSRAAGGPSWMRIAFPGKLGPLVAGATRQMFSVLDTYVALLIALGGWLYRFCYPSPEPEAYVIFSLLIAMALSTYAQCLFGLESESAMTRYRLLPVGRREIVLAKDAALLGLLLLLTLPLDPLAGMTSGLASLAIGHIALSWRPNPQYRWRFTGGRLALGVAQLGLGAGFGVAAARNGPIYGVLTILGYLAGVIALTKGSV
jgi:hypothetical protein